ncbi:hypothetical protein GCM10020295_54890 [Streptomyces cinereospinus]
MSASRSTSGWPETPRHPLAYRIHFAALGWADRHGHASFGPGKLAALLGTDGKPLSDQSTNNALARAKQLDLVSPRSGGCLSAPLLPPVPEEEGRTRTVPPSP